MTPRLPPVMWIPPPLLYAASFLAGLGIQRALSLDTFGFPTFLHWVGGLLIAVGAVCALGNALYFLFRRTTLVPHGEPSQLIVHGAYRFTRNPMYLGLSLAYLGLALTLDAWVPLLLLPVPVLLIDRIVIPFEEAQLRRIQGPEYDVYCARVRRWL